MANFNYLDFFKTPTPNDNKLFIKDINNNVVWTISNFKISSYFAQNNNIRINFTNGDFVVIDFNNVYESKIALSRLKDAIATLNEKTPFEIDKDVKLYIESKQFSGPQGPQGHEGHAFTTLVANESARINSPTSFTFLNGAYSSSNVSTIESFDNSQGFYIQTSLPSLIDSDSIIFGAFANNIMSSYTINISYDNAYVVGSSEISGTYSTNDRFSIYSDGATIFYELNGLTIATDNYLSDSYYLYSYPNSTLSQSYTFSNVLFYPTGKKGLADKYFATASVFLAVPNIDTAVTFNTQTGLAFTSGQWVSVTSYLNFYYTVEEYSDDSIYGAKFYAEVDSYNPSTGVLVVINQYTKTLGATSSFWYINLSGQVGASGSMGPQGATGIGFNYNSGSNTYTIPGNLIIESTTTFQQTEEVINSSTASNIIYYDFNLGSIWYHNDLTSDYEAHFINMPTDNNKAITATIIINQGSSAYLPTSLFINEVPSFIKWGNATIPNGNANQTDIIGLSFITYNNSIVEILGQMSTYAIVGSVPTVTTDSISSGYPCVANATVVDDGGSNIIEMGIVYAHHTTPTISDSRVTASNPGTGSFTVDIIVSAYPESYGRAYAINSSGIGYGSEISFSAPCFAKGTLVTLSDGSSKKIEDINYNDELLVWNFDDSKFDSAKPVWIMKPVNTTDTFISKFSDGSELITAGKLGVRKTSHRIFNIEKGEFTYLISDEDTPIGTHTFNNRGEIVTLISREQRNELTEIYNIVTFGHLNMFCNTLLTSIRLNNIYPIQNMKFIKDNRQIIPIDKFEGLTEEYYNGFRLGEQPLVEVSENFATTNTTPTLEELISHMKSYYK